MLSLTHCMSPIWHVCRSLVLWFCLCCYLLVYGFMLLSPVASLRMESFACVKSLLSFVFKICCDSRKCLTFWVIEVGNWNSCTSLLGFCDHQIHLFLFFLVVLASPGVHCRDPSHTFFPEVDVGIFVQNMVHSLATIYGRRFPSSFWILLRFRDLQDVLVFAFSFRLCTNSLCSLLDMVSWSLTVSLYPSSIGSRFGLGGNDMWLGLSRLSVLSGLSTSLFVYATCCTSPWLVCM